MPTLRPFSHRRNRQPRPSAIIAPPAPVSIVLATVSHDPSNSVLLRLSGPVIVTEAFSGGIFDLDENEECTTHFWFEFAPLEINVGFPTEVNRIGHRIGWTTLPTWLGTSQLQILPDTLQIVTVDT